MLDAKDEKNSKGMCNIDHEAASPYTIHTAVLPKPSLINANIPATATSSLRAPIELPESFQKAFSS